MAFAFLGFLAMATAARGGGVLGQPHRDAARHPEVEPDHVLARAPCARCVRDRQDDRAPPRLRSRAACTSSPESSLSVQRRCATRTPARTLSLSSPAASSRSLNFAETGVGPDADHEGAGALKRSSCLTSSMGPRRPRSRDELAVRSARAPPALRSVTVKARSFGKQLADGPRRRRAAVGLQASRALPPASRKAK